MEFRPQLYKTRGSRGFRDGYGYYYSYPESDCGCDIVCHSSRCRMPGFASYDVAGDLLEVDWGPESSGLYWQNEVRPGLLHPIPCSYTITINDVANYSKEESWCDECEALNLTISTQALMNDNPWGWNYGYYYYGSQTAYTDFEYIDRRDIYDYSYYYSYNYLYGWYVWDGYDTKGFREFLTAPLCTPDSYYSPCNYYYLTIDIGIGLDADHLIDDSVCPSGHYDDYIYREEFKEEEGRPQLYVQAITTIRSKQLRATEETTTVTCAPFVVFPSFACSFCRNITPTWLYTPVMFRTVIGEFNGDYMVTNSGIRAGWLTGYVYDADPFISGIIPVEFTDQVCDIKPYHGDLDGRDLSFTVRGSDIISPAVFKIPYSVPEESGIYTACDFSNMSLTVTPRRQDEDKWGNAQFYEGRNTKFAQSDLVYDDVWVDRYPYSGVGYNHHGVSGVLIKGLSTFPLYGTCTWSFSGGGGFGLGIGTTYPCYDYGAAFTPEMGHGLISRSMWVDIQGVRNHKEDVVFDNLQYGDCFDSEDLNGKYNLNMSYYRKEPFYSGSPMLPQFGCGSLGTSICWRDPTIIYDFIFPTGICASCINDGSIPGVRARLVSESGTSVHDWNVSLYVEIPSQGYFFNEDGVGSKNPQGYWGFDNAEPYALFVHHFNNGGEAIDFSSIGRIGFTQIPPSSAPWLNPDGTIWSNPYYPANTGIHDFSNATVEAEFYPIQLNDCVDKHRKCWLCHGHNGPDNVVVDLSNLAWERVTECWENKDISCYFLSCNSPWTPFEDCTATYTRLCIDRQDGWPSGYPPSSWWDTPCTCVMTELECGEPYTSVSDYCGCYAAYYCPPCCGGGRGPCYDPAEAYTTTPEEYYAVDLLNSNYILDRKNNFYDLYYAGIRCVNLYGSIWDMQGFGYGAINADSECIWGYNDTCVSPPGWQQDYDPDCSGDYAGWSHNIYYYIDATFRREVFLSTGVGRFWFQEIRPSGDIDLSTGPYYRYTPQYSGVAVPTAPPYWDCDETVTLRLVRAESNGEFTLPSGTTITVSPYTGV